MDWIEVESTRVSKVAFDLDHKKVYVEFKSNGVVYVYNDVSEATFEQFINATSKGKAISLLGNNYHKLNWNTLN